MRACHTNRAEEQRGYNLVEVLVAMAILSSVLLSIMTLFFFGRRNVYSGKQLTLANAVATRVSEDLVPMSQAAMLGAFGITNTSALVDTTVAGRDYEDVVVVSTANTATDPQGYLGRWQTLMQQRNFANGRVSLVIQPTMFTAGSVFSTAAITRVFVVVEWREGRRNRSVVLNSAKYRI